MNSKIPGVHEALERQLRRNFSNLQVFVYRPQGHLYDECAELLNFTYRKINRQRSVFPSDTSLLKALYLATFEATKKWITTIRDWAQVYGELSIMYEGLFSE